MVLSSDAPRLAVLVATPTRDALSPAAALLLAVVRPGAAAAAARLTSVALPAVGRGLTGGRPAGTAGAPGSSGRR